jgi:hypothetical protein
MVSLAGWFMVGWWLVWLVGLSGWFDGKSAARAFGRFSIMLVARPVGWFAGKLVVRLFSRFAGTIGGLAV